MIQFEYIRVNGLTGVFSTGKDISFSWKYAQTYSRNVKQNSFEIRIYGSDGTGVPVFSSGTVRSSACRFEPSDFIPKERADYVCTVCTVLSDGSTVMSDALRFHTGIFSRESFESLGARWITCGLPKEKCPQAPRFTRSITLPRGREIASAKAYIFAAGFSYFTVNGNAPDDRLLAPANSKYENRCYYETYDISEQLRGGVNTLSLVCGSGYDENYSEYGNRYFGKKGFIGAVEIKYADGSSVTVPSDGRWKCTASEVRECSMYGGEAISLPPKKSRSLPVSEADETAPYYPYGLLLPRPIPHIRPVAHVFPVSCRETDGGILCDFGENTTGIAEISVIPASTSTVTLFHSEMINPDGTPDPETNRGAKAEDSFIAEGGKTTAYFPRFTYHCFRYLLVRGVKSDETVSVKKAILAVDVPLSGSFSCSDPLLNRIHSNAVTGMRNNLFSIPTDCPVRDERTPCDMDSQAIERAVMTNFDTQAYYTAWLSNVIDRYVPGQGNPDWKGDIVSLMWRIYDFYGDIRPAETHYDTALSYFYDVLSRSDNGICNDGFGDWCHPNENCWNSFFGSVTSVNTSLLYGMGQKLISLGKVIGRDGRTISGLEKACRKISSEFEKRCIGDDGTVCGGKQTDYLLPLYENMLAGDKKKKAAEALSAKIRSDGYLDAGIYGEMSAFRVLREIGENELALSLLRSVEYPSFGNQIAKGATSLWEQWRYKGQMDSHSHGMFAGADTFFYETVAGITPSSPGYATVKIAPMMSPSVPFAEASVGTPGGTLSVRYELIARGYELIISVPVGCTADVALPDIPGEKHRLFDGELPIEYKPEITVGSGFYRFRFVPESLLTDH